jgi:hypothetical protein
LVEHCTENAGVGGSIPPLGTINIFLYFIVKDQPFRRRAMIAAGIELIANQVRECWGRLEVDLLCPTARVAIELDGSHHLGTVEAYRRDRRKDQLLQENGYFVLRFLAEDAGKS